uniref:Coat protein n=1 Tax=Erysiphales associated totivirus 21 TaxID=2719851 RepID=A0A6G9EN29_9VIRU|nr:coat protein [Erysiphales associated totivirus 21]
MNDLALHDMIMKIVPENDLTRARVNRMINIYLENSYYDNATALIARMMQDMWIIKLAALNNVYREKLVIHVSMLANCKTINSYISVLMASLSKGPAATGFSERDADFEKWATLLHDWVEELEDKRYSVDKDGRKTETVAYRRAEYTIEYNVWKMYSYDDGHSTSGNHFGDALDFVNNRFKVPANIGVIPENQRMRLQYADPWSSMSDKEIDNRSTAAGHINCDNLTSRQVAMLNAYLDGHKRNTPFLVDQDLEFGNKDGDYIAYNAEKIPSGTTHYTAADVASLINILVANHRWYEDARSAYHALMFWIAQPSTDTVESHWWVTSKRTLVLPELGLSRAMFPMFTVGDGVQITKQALEDASAITAGGHSAIFNSLAMNATWFWGEYMAVYNHKSMAAIYGRYNDNIDTKFSSQTRALSLVSALTGMVVPTPCFQNVYTHLTGGLNMQRRRVVKFGNIDSTMFEKYRYQRNGNDITLNAVVPPGAMGVVLGMNGTLMANTPLASIFSVEAPHKDVSFNGDVHHRYSFMNLWAAGVVARWQGFDLAYNMHGSKSSYVMFAANDVSLALPPAFESNEDDAGWYTVRDVVRRRKVFGSDLLSGWNVRKVFTWVRGPVEPLEKCDRYALATQVNDRVSHFGVSLLVADDVKIHYVSALISKYDTEQGDFHETRQRTAVPLPTNAGPLEQELLTDEPLEQETALQGEAGE